jgi:aminoglycoside phosphotransferase (APT) family kinase protein
MAPDRDRLTAALAWAFSRNGHARGALIRVRRDPTPYVTTFDCEIVSCRFSDGSRLRVFCKYTPQDGSCSYGQRGGIGYEAEVYRQILQPSGASVPDFYGCYTDPATGGTWLLLEYLRKSLRAGKISGLRAMKMAARWIGQFHAANAERARLSTSFLTAYDAAYYEGWPRRAASLARDLGLKVPRLQMLVDRLQREIPKLAALPQTIIHGEYYPHNVMFQAGVVRPVDWETAAIAPGEIDLATLTEGWSPEDTHQLELEYQRARWPEGPPKDFQRNLDLARAYMQLRWLGDDDPKWTRNMSRWKVLRDVSERLQLT